MNLKYEQKVIKEWKTRFTSMKFVHFWVVLVRKCMIKKYLISDCFGFLDWLFSNFVYNSVWDFYIIGSKMNG